MRTTTTIALFAAATALFASGAAFAQESPICEAAPIRQVKNYNDPATGELCMSSVTRISRFNDNPDAEGAAQGRLSSGYENVSFQNGSDGTYFIGRLRKHLEVSIHEPTEMACDDPDSSPATREVVVETVFFFDEARMVSRNCATGTTFSRALPASQRPYMESVIHWDSPCGSHPMDEVIDYELFSTYDELDEVLDLYIQGDCSY